MFKLKTPHNEGIKIRISECAWIIQGDGINFLRVPFVGASQTMAGRPIDPIFFASLWFRHSKYESLKNYFNPVDRFCGRFPINYADRHVRITPFISSVANRSGTPQKDTVQINSSNITQGVFSINISQRATCGRVNFRFWSAVEVYAAIVSKTRPRGF